MWRTLVAGGVLAGALACGEPPPEHSEAHGTAMHRPGGRQARDNCAQCHGQDLMGEGEAPSCYQCHDQQWL